MTTHLLILLALPSVFTISPLSADAQARRTLGRFTRGHPDNELCWDRHGVDGFISIVDGHNHPMPFGGPEVPYETYYGWMVEHGLLFGTQMGIGQVIVRQNQSAPECCYYLHCPTFKYPVIPSTVRDEQNADARAKYYTGKFDAKFHMITAATFPNLQRPVGAKKELLKLQHKYPRTFKWMGELNVFKHALAGNGFFSDFTGKPLTVNRVLSGELDDLFSVVGRAQSNGEHIPTVTLHSDMGCDKYAFPVGSGDGVHPLVCEASDEEKKVAQRNHHWWEETLGPFYAGFFDVGTHYPKDNFKKIRHIHVTDSIIGRYPEVKFVWAHVGYASARQRENARGEAPRQKSSQVI